MDHELIKHLKAQKILLPDSTLMNTMHQISKQTRAQLGRANTEKYLDEDEMRIVVAKKQWLQEILEPLLLNYYIFSIFHC